MDRSAVGPFGVIHRPLRLVCPGECVRPLNNLSCDVYVHHFATGSTKTQGGAPRDVSVGRLFVRAPRAPVRARAAGARVALPLAAGAAVWARPPPWFAGARAPEAPCCDVL